VYYSLMLNSMIW